MNNRYVSIHWRKFHPRAGHAGSDAPASSIHCYMNLLNHDTAGSGIQVVPYFNCHRNLLNHDAAGSMIQLVPFIAIGTGWIMIIELVQWYSWEPTESWYSWFNDPSDSIHCYRKLLNHDTDGSMIQLVPSIAIGIINIILLVYLSIYYIVWNYLYNNDYRSIVIWKIIDVLYMLQKSVESDCYWNVPFDSHVTGSDFEGSVSHHCMLTLGKWAWWSSLSSRNWRKMLGLYKSWIA